MTIYSIVWFYNTVIECNSYHVNTLVLLASAIIFIPTLLLAVYSTHGVGMHYRALAKCLLSWSDAMV